MTEPDRTETTVSIEVACADLDAAIDALGQIGFRLDATGPADEPTWGELSRDGLRLRVDAGGGVVTGLTIGPAPAGTKSDGPVVPPTAAAEVITHEAGGSWTTGRAGMRYRDLLPDRHGGAYIASHIHVPQGGPVPDYVHHHDVVHQLIFCHRGWVRVVYQDQGPPFVLEPGDVVLQPPGIRHRVLETSDDLFVVEVGCPADHRTSVDHDLALPTATVEVDRRFGGQRFARHETGTARWQPSGDEGFEEQASELAGATDGLVATRLLRPLDRGATLDLAGDDDLRLVFVHRGTARLVGPGDLSGADPASAKDAPPEELREGSSVVVPAGTGRQLTDLGPDTVLFEVRAAPPPGRR